MNEKTIQQIMTRYPNEVWPGLKLTFVEGERRLAGGKIIDLLLRDDRDVHWVAELKRDRVTPDAVRQLAGYLQELRAIEPSTFFRGVAAAFAISPDGWDEAVRQDVACWILDESRLRRVAESHGLQLDREPDEPPGAQGSQLVPSQASTKRPTRPPTSDDDVKFLRRLNELFPPGTLDASSTIEQLRAYWQAATPGESPHIQEIATQLTHVALQALRHVEAAVANRRLGKVERYTTVMTLDGRVAVAIDARKSYARLDFPLPPDFAKQCKDKGLLRIGNKGRPRGRGLWCLSRVGDSTPLSLSKAIELLRFGLASGFGGEPHTTPELT